MMDIMREQEFGSVAYFSNTMIEDVVDNSLPVCGEAFDNSSLFIEGCTDQDGSIIFRDSGLQTASGFASCLDVSPEVVDVIHNLGSDTFIGLLFNHSKIKYSVLTDLDGKDVSCCVIRIDPMTFVVTRDYRIFYKHADRFLNIDNRDLLYYNNLRDYRFFNPVFNREERSKHYVQLPLNNRNLSLKWIRHIHLLGVAFKFEQLVDILNYVDSTSDFDSLFGLEINHLNKDVFNNTIYNIEWCTSNMNKLHRDVFKSFNTFSSYYSHNGGFIGDECIPSGFYKWLVGQLYTDGLSCWDLNNFVKSCGSTDHTALYHVYVKSMLPIYYNGQVRNRLTYNDIDTFNDLDDGVVCPTYTFGGKMYYRDGFDKIHVDLSK